MTDPAPIDVESSEMAVLFDLENIRLCWEKYYNRLFCYTDLCWLCELVEQRFNAEVGRVVVFMSDPKECEGTKEQLRELQRIHYFLEKDQERTSGGPKRQTVSSACKRGVAVETIRVGSGATKRRRLSHTPVFSSSPVVAPRKLKASFSPLVATLVPAVSPADNVHTVAPPAQTTIVVLDSDSESELAPVSNPEKAAEEPTESRDSVPTSHSDTAALVSNGVIKNLHRVANSGFPRQARTVSSLLFSSSSSVVPSLPDLVYQVPVSEDVVVDLSDSPKAEMVSSPSSSLTSDPDHEGSDESCSSYDHSPVIPLVSFVSRSGFASASLSSSSASRSSCPQRTDGRDGGTSSGESQFSAGSPRSPPPSSSSSSCSLAESSTEADSSTALEEDGEGESEGGLSAAVEAPLVQQNETGTILDEGREEGEALEEEDEQVKSENQVEEDAGSSNVPFVRLGLSACPHAEVAVRAFGYKMSGRRRVQRCCDVAIGNEVTKLCFMARYSSIVLFSADSDFEETARSCAEAEDLGGVIKYAKTIRILGFSFAFEASTAARARESFFQQRRQQQKFRQMQSRPRTCGALCHDDSNDPLLLAINKNIVDTEGASGYEGENESGDEAMTPPMSYKRRGCGPGLPKTLKGSSSSGATHLPDGVSVYLIDFEFPVIRRVLARSQRPTLHHPQHSGPGLAQQSWRGSRYCQSQSRLLRSHQRKQLLRPHPHYHHHHHARGQSNTRIISRKAQQALEPTTQSFAAALQIVASDALFVGQQKEQQQQQQQNNQSPNELFLSSDAMQDFSNGMERSKVNQQNGQQTLAECVINLDGMEEEGGNESEQKAGYAAEKKVAVPAVPTVQSPLRASCGVPLGADGAREDAPPFSLVGSSTTEQNRKEAIVASHSVPVALLESPYSSLSESEDSSSESLRVVDDGGGHSDALSVISSEDSSETETEEDARKHLEERDISTKSDTVDPPVVMTEALVQRAAEVLGNSQTCCLGQIASLHPSVCFDKVESDRRDSAAVVESLCHNTSSCHSKYLQANNLPPAIAGGSASWSVLSGGSLKPDSEAGRGQKFLRLPCESDPSLANSSGNTKNAKKKAFRGPISGLSTVRRTSRTLNMRTVAAATPGISAAPPALPSRRWSSGMGSEHWLSDCCGPTDVLSSSSHCFSKENAQLAWKGQAIPESPSAVLPLLPPSSSSFPFPTGPASSRMPIECPGYGVSGNSAFFSSSDHASSIPNPQAFFCRPPVASTTSYGRAAPGNDTLLHPLPPFIPNRMSTRVATMPGH